MSTERDNNFDLIRLIAAIQVMVWHGVTHFKLLSETNYPWLVPVFQLPGVPIFFSLSGYLIFQSWQSMPNIKQYTIKRCLRIYPALWVCFGISLFLILTSACPESFLNLKSLAWVLAQLSFGQVYNIDTLSCWGTGVPNGSLWSITVEIQFYILLPFLLYFASKLSKTGAKNIFWVAVFSLSIVWNILLNNQSTESLIDKFSGAFVLTYFRFFVVGILFYQNKTWIKAKVEGKFPLWFFIFWAYTYAVIYFKGGQSVYNMDIWAFIGLVLMGLMTFSLAFSFKSLSKKLLSGHDLSYGIYIYHMVVFNAIYHYKKELHVLGFLAACFVVIFLAFISWKYIEKPALSLKNQLLSSIK